MKELVQKKDWDYSIYNVNGKKIISVVFYNRGRITREVFF